MTIQFNYKAKSNPEGRCIPGVPLADLTKDEFTAFPGHVQQAIQAAPYYVEVVEAPAVKAAEKHEAKGPEKSGKKLFERVADEATDEPRADLVKTQE